MHSPDPVRGRGREVEGERALDGVQLELEGDVLPRDVLLHPLALGHPGHEVRLEQVLQHAGLEAGAVDLLVVGGRAGGAAGARTRGLEVGVLGRVREVVVLLGGVLLVAVDGGGLTA